MEQDKWSKIIVHWVNCLTIPNLKVTSSRDLDVRILYQIIDHLDSLENGGTDDTSHHSNVLTSFLKREYPHFNRHAISEKLDEEQSVIIASLLLHYSCIKTKDVGVRGAMCQRLSPNDQKAIMFFANSLMKYENITKKNIKETMVVLPLSEVGSPMPPSGSPGWAGSPATPPGRRGRRSRRLMHLEAALETERFDRTYLQEELHRQAAKVEEMEKQHALQVSEITALRGELSSCYNGSHVGGECGAGGIPGQDGGAAEAQRLRRDLAGLEQELLKVVGDLANMAQDRETMRKKVGEVEKELTVWRTRAMEFENMTDTMQVKLDNDKSQMSDLKMELAEKNKMLEEYRQEHQMNESIECDDETSTLKKTFSSSFGVENLGNAVIDVQLKEQIIQNTVLNSQITELQNERKSLDHDLNVLAQQYATTKLEYQDLFMSNIELKNEVNITKHELEASQKEILDKISEISLLVEEKNCAQDLTKRQESDICKLNEEMLEKTNQITMVNEGKVKLEKDLENSRYIMEENLVNLKNNADLINELKNSIQILEYNSSTLLKEKNDIETEFHNSVKLLINEKSALETDLKNNADNHNKEILEKANKFEELNAKLEGVLNDKAELQRDLCSLEAEKVLFQNQCKEKQAKIDNILKEFDSLHEENNELKDLAQQYATTRLEYQDLFMSNIELKNEVNITKHELEASQKEILDKISEISLLVEEKNCAQDLTKRQESDICKLSEEMLEKTNQITMVNEGKVKLEKDLENSQYIMEENLVNLKNNADLINELQNSIQTLEYNSSTLFKEKNDIETEFHNSVKLLINEKSALETDFKNNIENHNKEVLEKANQFEELNAKLEGVLNDKAELQRDLCSLEAEKVLFQNQCEEKQAKIGNVLKEFDSLHEENNGLKVLAQQYATTRLEYQDLVMSNIELKNEVDITKHQLEASQKGILDKISEISLLVEEKNCAQDLTKRQESDLCKLNEEMLEKTNQITMVNEEKVKLEKDLENSRYIREENLVNLKNNADLINELKNSIQTLEYNSSTLLKEKNDIETEFHNSVKLLINEKSALETDFKNNTENHNKEVLEKANQFEELNAKLEGVLNDKAELQRDLCSLKAEKVLFQNQCKEKQAKIDNILKKFDSLHEENKSLSDKISNIEKDLTLHVETIGSLNTPDLEFENTAMEFENMMDTIQVKLDNDNSQMSDLKMELAEKNKMLEEYRQEQQIYESVECDDDTSTLKKTFSSSFGVENLGNAVIDVQLKEQIIQNTVLNSQITELQNERKSLDHELKDLAQQYATTRLEYQDLFMSNIELKNEVNFTKHELDASQKEILDKISEISLLAEEKNCAQDLTKRQEGDLCKLNEEMLEKTNQIKMVNEEKIKLEKELENSRCITGENLVVLKNNAVFINELNNSIQTLEYNSSTLLKEKNDIETEFHNSVKLLINEKSALETDLKNNTENHNKEISELNAKLEGVLNDKAELRRDLCSLEAEKVLFQNQFKEKQAKIDNILKKFDSLHEENKTLRNKISNIEKDLSLHIETIESLNTSNLEFENMTDTIQVKLDNDNSQMSDLKMELAEKNKMLQEYRQEQQINESVECDDNTSTLKKTFSSSFRVKNLGNAVIDVQLKEQIIQNTVLNSQITELQNERKSLDHDLKVLAQQYATTKLEYQDLFMSNIELKNEVNITKHELEASQREILDKISEISLLVEEKNCAQDLTKRQEGDLCKLNEEMLEKTNQIKMLNEVKIKLEKDLENSQYIMDLKNNADFINELKNSIQVLEYNSSTLLKEKNDIETEFRNSVKLLINEKSTLETDLKNNTDNHNIEILKKGNQFVELNAKLEGVLNDKAELQRDLCSLEAEKVLFQNQCKEKQAKIDNVLKEFDSLNEENKSLSDKISNIEKYLTLHLETIESLNTSDLLATITMAKSSIDFVDNYVDNLCKVIVSLVQDRTTCRNSLDLLQKQNTVLSKECQTYKKKHEETTNKMNNITKKLSQVELVEEKLEKSLNNSDDSLSLLQKQNTILTKECQTYKKKHEETTNKMNNIAEKLSQVELVKEKLEKSLNNSDDSVSLLRKQNTILSKECQTYKKKHEETTNKMNNIAEKLSQVELVKEKLEKSLNNSDAISSTTPSTEFHIPPNVEDFIKKVNENGSRLKKTLALQQTRTKEINMLKESLHKLNGSFYDYLGDKNALRDALSTHKEIENDISAMEINNMRVFDEIVKFSSDMCLFTGKSLLSFKENRETDTVDSCQHLGIDIFENHLENIETEAVTIQNTIPKLQASLRQLEAKKSSRRIVDSPSCISLEHQGLPFYEQMQILVEKYVLIQQDINICENSKMLTMQSLKQMQDKNTELSNENNELMNKVSALRKVLKEIESRNNDLMVANEELKYHKDHRESSLVIEKELHRKTMNENMALKNQASTLSYKMDELKLRLNSEMDDLKSANDRLVLENQKVQAKLASGGDTNQLVTDMRNEYEDKLTRMKQKMKQLYQEQIAVYTEKQRDETTGLEALCKKYSEKINKYETHVNHLMFEQWKVGEKLLNEKKQNDELRKRLEEWTGSHQSLNSITSTVSLPQSRMEMRRNTISARAPSRRPYPSPVKEMPSAFKQSRSNKAESGGLHMSDEEGEVFDNTYLTEIQAGGCTPRASSILTQGALSTHGGSSRQLKPAPTDNRLSELQWRNSLCLPHLKSSYSVESQFHRFREEDIKMGGTITLDDSPSVEKPRMKKEAGQTSYRKPGPPTPIKNGGRLSLQGNEREVLPLREQNDMNNTKKATTPSRIKSLFMGNNTSKSTSRDENTLGTPKGRRLSIFRKPR